MTEELREELISFANKYETPEFMENDPSKFLRWYSLVKGDSLSDIECAAFIAAMLSFGRREQFIPKIEYILKLADSNSGSIYRWLINGFPSFPFGKEKFYRFYSFDDLRDLFEEMVVRRDKGDSPMCIFEIIKKKYDSNQDENLADYMTSFFKKSKIVPKGKNSAKKRVYMFLRWMVRQDSPVDLGIWNWYSPEKLIIPMDIHVIQESIKLGLLDKKSKPSIKSAIKLTTELKQVFPTDPCKGDFALFGLGIDNN